MSAVRTRRAGGRAKRRGTVAAVQQALFEVEVRPERRYYRQIVDALRRSDFGADGLESELTISRLFGTIWAGQEGPRDGSTEEAFGLGLVDFARHQRTPTAVAMLRTIATIAAIREVRDAADQAAEMLTSGGLPDPRWTRPIGAASPGRCWAYEDVFGDQSTVICEFAYGTERTAERHAIVIYVDHAMFSVATDGMLALDVDPFIRDLRNDAKNSAPMFTLRQVDPAWARALLARAFARTDLIEGVEVAPTLAELRALSLARVGVLPEDPAALPPEPVSPTSAECRALVEEFLAGAEGSALPDRAAAERLANRIVEYSCQYDPGGVSRVSPAKWETFVFDWLSKVGFLPPAERTAMPDVVRAWSAWAGRRMALPGAATDELAFALDEMLGEYAGGQHLG